MPDQLDLTPLANATQRLAEGLARYELDPPYKMDVVDWATTDDTFRSRIASAHIVIQQSTKRKD